MGYFAGPKSRNENYTEVCFQVFSISASSGQGSTDCMVRGLLGPNWSEILFFFGPGTVRALKFCSSEIVRSWSALVRTFPKAVGPGLSWSENSRSSMVRVSGPVRHQLVLDGSVSVRGPPLYRDLPADQEYFQRIHLENFQFDCHWDLVSTNFYCFWMYPNSSLK